MRLLISSCEFAAAFFVQLDTSLVRNEAEHVYVHPWIKLFFL